MTRINTIPLPLTLERQVAIDIDNINRPRPILSCLNPDSIPSSRSPDNNSTEIDDDDEIVLLKKLKHN